MPATNTTTNASEGGTEALSPILTLPMQGEKSSGAASGAIQLIAIGISTAFCFCMLCIGPVFLYCRRRKEADSSKAIVPQDNMDFSDLAGGSLPWGPLDLVCCIESSSNVGKKGLQCVTGILENLIRQLEMPPVKVGVVSFASTICGVCQLSRDKEAILGEVRALPWMPQDANANLLQPLQKAGSMLGIEGASSMGESPSLHDGRSKVILVVRKSSDDPRDLAEADPVAADLKTAGATVLFLQMGDTASRFASEKIASTPTRQYVFHLCNYNGPELATDAVLGRLSEIVSASNNAPLVAAAGRPYIEPVYMQNMQNPSEGRAIKEHHVQLSLRERPAASPQDVEQQTDPLIKVCLAPWRQVPLDLVICIDCHGTDCSLKQQTGSQVVGISAFDEAKVFVEQLASTVQMPEVRLALQCVGETVNNVADKALTGNLHDFNVRLRGAAPGRSTQPSLGMALREACSVLRSETRSPEADALKAVLVVTDGEFSEEDWGGAHPATELWKSGVQLLVVKFGRIMAVGGSSPGEVGAMKTKVLPHTFSPAVGSQCGIFECSGEPGALRNLVPDVLRQLVVVYQQIVRARCVLPTMPTGEVAADFDKIEGHEVQLPEGVVLGDPSPVPWEPGLLDVSERHYKHRYKDLGRCLCHWLEPQKTACPRMHVGTLHGTAASDGVSIPEKVSTSVQTDPIVKVSLWPWRQSPLDLVICLLNSSPDSTAPQSGLGKGLNASTQHVAALEHQKRFIECLARCFHMPEVRLRLLSGQVEVEWSNTMEDFVSAVHNISTSSVVEVPRLAPGLRRALHLFGPSVRGTRESLSFGATVKAMLIITDGGHVDNLQELQEVASTAMARGVQIHLVQTAQGSRASGTSTLASLATYLRSQSAQGSTFNIADSAEALDALLPQLLRQLLRVTRRIMRARCTLPLEPYEVVASEDLASTEGHEVMLPQDEVFIDGQPVAWDPSLVACLEPQEPVPGADAGGGPELSELEELAFRIHCAAQEKQCAEGQGAFDSCGSKKLY